MVKVGDIVYYKKPDLHELRRESGDNDMAHINMDSSIGLIVTRVHGNGVIVVVGKGDTINGNTMDIPLYKCEYTTKQKANHLPRWF